LPPNRAADNQRQLKGSKENHSMPDTIEPEVRNFIIENFLFGDASQPIGAETSLIENDVVDSTGILELVAYIETQFEITMADEEIVPENLDSIARICAYVERKLSAGAPVAHVAMA
jgi:acyl carrier protein